MRLRLLLACLLAGTVSGCGGVASSSVSSTANLGASASRSVGWTSGSPSPTATPIPGRALAWTNQAVAVYPTPGHNGAAQAHLGANFPLLLTLETADVDGTPWCQAIWQTPGRHETGWLPSSAVTPDKPDGEASAAFDALDTTLAGYLDTFGTRVGVEVTDLTRGLTYTHNADLAYIIASTMKVPIMLTLLAQLEAKRREPTDTELSQLTAMIVHSDNNAATALYKQIGWQGGINRFMAKLGISGLSPATPTVGWGYSTVTPAAMIALLVRLYLGTVLNATHRLLALRLMEHVEVAQRIGVGDSSPAGATVAMKDGWISIADQNGPYVMNSTGIVTRGAETYVIGVFTIRDRSYDEGFAIARHVCDVVGDLLMGPA
jgi:beta-lactamase class A